MRVAVALIVLDGALRLASFAPYLSSRVMGASPDVILTSLAGFPAVLLPAALLVGQPDAPRTNRLLLAGTLLLAAAEIVSAAASLVMWGPLFSSSLAWLVTIDQLAFRLGMAAPVAALGGALLVGAGLLPRGGPPAPRLARTLGAAVFLLPAVGALAMLGLLIRYGSGPDALATVTTIAPAVLQPLMVGVVLWVSMGAALERRAPRRGWLLAILGGACWLLAGLLVELFMIVPRLFGVAWGGNPRWDAQAGLMILGVSLLDAALAVGISARADAVPAAAVSPDRRQRGQPAPA